MKIRKNNSTEKFVNEKIDEKIFESVKQEAIDYAQEFIGEDKLGYKFFVYREMKRRFEELGFDWEIPDDDPKSVYED